MSLPRSNICSNKMTDQGPWHIPGSSDTTLSLSRHWHSFPQLPPEPVSGVWTWPWSQWFNLPARHSRLTTCTPLNVNVRVQRQAETGRDTKHRLTHLAWHPVHEQGIHHQTGDSSHLGLKPLSSKSRDCPSWRYRDKSHSVTGPVTVSSLCPLRSGSDYGWDKWDPGTGNWLLWLYCRFWHDL